MLKEYSNSSGECNEEAKSPEGRLEDCNFSEVLRKDINSSKVLKNTEDSTEDRNSSEAPKEDGRCAEVLQEAVWSAESFLVEYDVGLHGVSVSSMSCGKEHHLLLTAAGVVYSWGRGTRGQLGHGDLMSSDLPQVVEALAGLPVSSVCAGGWHSAAVVRWGDAYMSAVICINDLSPLAQ